MGQCRNLMPVNRLDEWKAWLIQYGWEVIDKEVMYSPWGVRIDGRTYRVYVRLGTLAGEGVIHASIHGPLVRLARQYLRSIRVSPYITTVRSGKLDGC